MDTSSMTDLLTLVRQPLNNAALLIPVLIVFLFLVGRSVKTALIVLAGVAFLSITQMALADEICVPSRYADGDTFSFKRAGQTIPVRIAGFDAPEKGQPFSKQATERLQLLTREGSRCSCYKTDKFGRSVCIVRTMGGDHIAPLMLGAGLGCIDSRFENEAEKSERARARTALADAQARRVGMWSDPQAKCAAEFRKERRHVH